MPTTLKSAQSDGLLLAINKYNGKVTRIATTSPLQVGMLGYPVELQLSGGLLLKTIEISLSGGSEYVIPLQAICLYVSLSGTGDVSITLPENPFSGQLIIIKDVLGLAATNNIIVSGHSGHLIDGSATVTMSNNYEALQLVWNNNRWSIICCGDGGRGGGGGAPEDATYVVTAANGTLTNEKVLTAGSNITITSGVSTVTISASSSGDVTGPASSTNAGIARFSGTTGKIIQNSGVTIDASNNVVIPGDLTVNGDVIDIGTTAVTRTINLGTGTGGTVPQTLTIGSDNTSSSVTMKSGTGKFEITTEQGDIEIGAAAHSGVSRNVKLGTGANSSEEHVYIGSSSSASSLSLNSGTGAILIGTTSSSRTVELATGLGDQIVKVGSPSSASELTLDSGTGDIKIGARDSARNIYIGSHPDSGTGGSANNKQQIYIGARGAFTGNEVNICDGVSGTGHKVRIISTNSYHSSAGSDEIEIGTINDSCLTTIGNESSNSYVKIYGGTQGVTLTSTGDISIGTSSHSRTTNISTAAGAQIVTLGSLSGTSSTTIQAGTGGITLTGEVLKPSQPAFLARLSTDQTSIVTSTEVTVRYSAEVFDIGSDYNNSTWTYTAPKDGKYLFNVSLYLTNIDTAASDYYVDLVTSNATYRMWALDPSRFNNDVSKYGVSNSIVVDMDSSDSAYVVIYQGGGTSQTSIVATQRGSFFSGYLLG